MVPRTMQQGSGQQADFFVNPEFITKNQGRPRIAAPHNPGFCHMDQTSRVTGSGSALSQQAQDGTAKPDASPAGHRFDQRRADIVAGAIPILNSKGFKGMRLTAVAEVIGLRATGVTYYFPRKEDLAVACLETGFDIFHRMLDQAEVGNNAAERLTRLISVFIERDAAVRRMEAQPLASFAAIRALEGEQRQSVAEGYKRVFRRVQNLLKSSELTHLDAPERNLRTIILLEQLSWTSGWLDGYDLDLFPRFAARMSDIVVGGLAPLGTLDGAATIDLDAAVETPNESFLVAATREINARGYRGASVDRIAAGLNRTKGAFYHYNKAKDDLVAACFRRSFDLACEAQRRALASHGPERDRLAAAVAGLVRFQLGPRGPMLCAAVMSSMPSEHQAEIIAQSNTISRQFGAMIADGVADGSVRPVDPAIAGALLHAAINAAAEVRELSLAAEPDLVARFLRALFGGLASA